jgi:hypothetical protein
MSIFNDIYFVPLPLQNAQIIIISHSLNSPKLECDLSTHEKTILPNREERGLCWGGTCVCACARGKVPGRRAGSCRHANLINIIYLS